jgi:hypothetical protein
MLGLAGTWAGHALSRGQFGDQIQHAARAFRRVRENFLVQPFHPARVEALGSGMKEQVKEFAEKLLDQQLEALIVIHRGSTWENSRASLPNLDQFREDSLIRSSVSAHHSIEDPKPGEPNRWRLHN